EGPAKLSQLLQLAEALVEVLRRTRWLVRQGSDLPGASSLFRPAAPALFVRERTHVRRLASLPLACRRFGVVRSRVRFAEKPFAARRPRPGNGPDARGLGRAQAGEERAASLGASSWAAVEATSEGQRELTAALLTALAQTTLERTPRSGRDIAIRQPVRTYPQIRSPALGEQLACVRLCGLAACQGRALQDRHPWIVGAKEVPS